jgi:hypothetical protein
MLLSVRLLQTWEKLEIRAFLGVDSFVVMYCGISASLETTRHLSFVLMWIAA